MYTPIFRIATRLAPRFRSGSWVNRWFVYNSVAQASMLWSVFRSFGADQGFCGRSVTRTRVEMRMGSCSWSTHVYCDSISRSKRSCR